MTFCSRPSRAFLAIVYYLQPMRSLFSDQRLGLLLSSDRHTANGDLQEGPLARCEQTISATPGVVLRFQWLLSSSRHRYGRSEPSNPFEYGPKEPLWYGHLSHLEDDVPGMSNNFGSDLDKLLSECRQ